MGPTLESLTPLGPDGALLALLAQSTAERRSAARVSVELSCQETERLRAEIQRQSEEAMKAQEEAGFWGSMADFFGIDVAKIAELVAAVAVIGATGGSATPLLFVALACTAGAELAKELGAPEYVTLALSLAAAATAACSGVAGGTGLGKAAGVFADIAKAAQATAGAAQAVGIGAGAVEAQHIRERDRANARAERASDQQEIVRLAIERALGQLRAVAADAQNTAHVGARIQAERAYNSEYIIQNWGGR